MSAYPEHAKIDEAAADVIEAFVTWLDSNGYYIAVAGSSVRWHSAQPLPRRGAPAPFDGSLFALLYHGVDVLAYDQEVATLRAEQQARWAAVQNTEPL